MRLSGVTGFPDSSGPKAGWTSFIKSVAVQQLTSYQAGLCGGHLNAWQLRAASGVQHFKKVN